MKRAELIHLLQAAAEIVDEDEFVIVGSQAVLGNPGVLPEALLLSMEADIYPLRVPDRAIEIDGALGEGSPFRELYGYWAHGVGPETPWAPAGWQSRLIPLELPGFHTSRQRTITGWCLSAADLVLSKLAAGRAKDIEFVGEALRAGIVNADRLELGLELMEVRHRERTAANLRIVLARRGTQP